MSRGFMGVLGAVGAIALTAVAAGPVSAESPAEFYSKNKLQIYHAASAKGSYGLHSRLLQKYLTKHIVGHPKITLYFMPGGGGKKAANWLYNLAPKDGTTIAALLKTMAEGQAVRAPGVRYDMRKFNYIASVGPMNSVLAIWNKTSPAKTIAGMKKKQVIVGSTGKTSVTNICPKLMNHYLGTKFKVVMGYKGMGPIMLAIERGEVHGRCGDAAGIFGGYPHWMNDKLATLVVHMGLNNDPLMPGVPRVLDLAETPEQKEVFGFFAASAAIGRWYVAPPKFPADRLAALQKGFMAALNDPQYREDLKKRKQTADPVTADQLRKLVETTLTASSGTINKARSVLGLKN